MNDNGLNALKAVGYQYDESLEETQPAGYVAALINADTASKKGFNWIPWPYTLDNGSPGIWNQQAGGNQQWITNFPTGVWETPTYEVYVPSANGLGKTIANTMLKADKACTFPAGTPAAQMQHCFLSPGELAPGDAETEITGFDFNMFIYCRMTPDQWFTVMQHTFLLRYYGLRSPTARTRSSTPNRTTATRSALPAATPPTRACIRWATRTTAARRTTTPTATS
jgi:hypothetical protein